jgi:hypothetical protein
VAENLDSLTQILNESELKDGHELQQTTKAKPLLKQSLELFLDPQPTQRKEFEEFMILEFAVENLYFLDAVVEFKSLFSEGGGVASPVVWQWT